MIIDGRTVNTSRLTRAEIAFARKHGDLPAIRIVNAKAKAAPVERALKAIYAGLSVVAFVTTIYNANITVELAAYTPSGDRYTAGAGDTCPDAFKGAVIPADWRELRCEAFDIFGFEVSNGGAR